jgi:ribosomal protein S4
MSNTKYKPRLKRGILGNKCFVLSSKNLKNLKKRKWKSFTKSFSNIRSSEPLVRNDVHFVQNKTFDLRKNYKKALQSKQQTSAFLSTFNKNHVRKIFSPKLGVKAACDSIEMRLDMVLLRSNLSKTLHQARWCIASGFVSVNKIGVRTLSYQLKVGDLVQISYRGKKVFEEAVFSLPSDYLEVNYNTLSVIVVDKPSSKNEKELSKLYSFFFGLEDIKNFNKTN